MEVSFTFITNDDIKRNAIINAVCQVYHTTLGKIRAGYRYPKDVLARRCLIHYLKKHTTMTLSKIGKMCGIYSHSTVIYNLKKSKDNSEVEKILKNILC